MPVEFEQQLLYNMLVEFLKEKLKEYEGRIVWMKEREYRIDFERNGMCNKYEYYCIDFSIFGHPHLKLRYINDPPVDDSKEGWRGWTLTGPEDFKDFKMFAENRMAKLYRRR